MEAWESVSTVCQDATLVSYLNCVMVMLRFCPVAGTTVTLRLQLIHLLIIEAEFTSSAVPPFKMVVRFCCAASSPLQNVTSCATTEISRNLFYFE